VADRRSPATPPVPLIVGPTGVGKSEVAVLVAERIDGEVISADSRAFFRGLDIATDKPHVEVRRRIPHHLIDRVEITGTYDAMAFRRDTDRLIDEISDRGHRPIVAGGGTLYVGALLHGLFAGPSADRALRRRLAALPLDALADRLMTVDPEAAARIHPNDRLRIVRALEVSELTGRPISELQRTAAPLPHAFVLIGLRRNRDDHRNAIAARVDRMLEAGLIGEIATLQRRGLNERCQAYRTIGVQEAVAFLAGEMTSDQLREALCHRTWALARRQTAWFRRESGISWIDVPERDREEVADRIVARLHAEADREYHRADERSTP